MTTHYKKILFFITLGGVLFSGYLSIFKIVTSTCALSEPCPYFFGYPACWYGFIMFLLMFIATITSMVRDSALKHTVVLHVIVSALGILFASYFTIPEISRMIGGGVVYTLGLPTCAYGLIFYILIFVLSYKMLHRTNA